MWEPIDRAAEQFAVAESASRVIAGRYSILDLDPPREAVRGAGTEKIRRLAIVDATAEHGRYDKTMLLLLGQERAPVALVVDQDTLTLATRFDSGISFLALLELGGGMPTLVSVQKERIGEVLRKLGAGPADLSRWTSP
jgi:hypothetical protein